MVCNPFESPVFLFYPEFIISVIFLGVASKVCFMLYNNVTEASIVIVGKLGEGPAKLGIVTKLCKLYVAANQYYWGPGTNTCLELRGPNTPHG